MPKTAGEQTKMDTIGGNKPILNIYGQLANMAFTLKTATKTAAYTCVRGDSGTVFDTVGATAAVTFTLPAVTITGWVGWFVCGANVGMTVTSAEGDNIIALNDLDIDSVAFNTTAERIGASIMLVSNGTNWLIFHGADEAQTATLSD